MIIFKLNDNVLAALGLSEILFYANESSFARDQIIWIISHLSRSTSDSWLVVSVGKITLVALYSRQGDDLKLSYFCLFELTLRHLLDCVGTDTNGKLPLKNSRLSDNFWPGQLGIFWMSLSQPCVWWDWNKAKFVIIQFRSNLIKNSL